jgi:hypothetical protein
VESKLKEYFMQKFLPVEKPPDYSQIQSSLKSQLERQRLDAKQDALAFLDNQADRIELVVAWLVDRGAPAQPEIQIQFRPQPSAPDESYFEIRILWASGNNTNDMDVVLMIARPQIALWTLAADFKDLNIQKRPWWREPAAPQPPVPRPISEHVDQRDPECMLSRGVPYDRFQMGAQWVDPDTVWVKERARSWFSTYARWRKVKEV